MLSKTFENVQNGEIISERGFRVAMASQPFWLGAAKLLLATALPKQTDR